MFRKAIDLPLHSGKCPAWLFSKMRDLSRVMVELILQEQLSGKSAILLLRSQFGNPIYVSDVGNAQLFAHMPLFGKKYMILHY